MEHKKIAHKTSLQGTYFVTLFSALTRTVAVSQLSHTDPAQLWSRFYAPHDISPCPVLPSTVSQLYPPRHHLSVTVKTASSLDRDDDSSVTNRPYIIICSELGSFFSYEMRQRSWLTYCTTSRKVAGSIPDGITRNFQ